MPSYYTRKGDDGTTGLIGDRRLPKSHPLFNSLGTLDEASAALGMARAMNPDAQTQSVLAQAQRDLYRLMAEIAGAGGKDGTKFQALDAGQLAWLESQVEASSSGLPALGEFILPGDTQAGAALAVARTVVRRAERSLVELVETRLVTNKVILPYLNRLSSLCFVLELAANQAARQETSKARDGSAVTG